MGGPDNNYDKSVFKDLIKTKYKNDLKATAAAAAQSTMVAAAGSVRKPRSSTTCFQCGSRKTRPQLGGYFFMRPIFY